MSAAPSTPTKSEDVGARIKDIFWPKQVRWWHEISCPAHSNNMRPESECNCLLGAVNEDLEKAIPQILQLIEEARQDEAILWAKNSLDFVWVEKRLKELGIKSTPKSMKGSSDV